MHGARVFAMVINLGLAASSCTERSPREPEQGSPVSVEAVGCVGMTVSDADKLASFYADVLTFRRQPETIVQGPEYEKIAGVAGLRARRIRLDLGSECIELDQPVDVALRPVPADSQSNDRWFQHVAIVVSDVQKAFQRLEEHHVAHASVAPQTLPDWNSKAAGIQAYYFKDPDSHTLEIIHFPKGKADPRWQATGSLFLGIDHTAIVVGDTEASLSFYTKRLGLHVAGGSENYGPEQERLNHVDGAHLRITTLRASSGPGVELLEYLFPRTGRVFPPDAHSTDLIHWRTTLLTASVPPSAVALRDPDGHTMELHPR
jgi:catechol 2,3-dioxygenase-like lactoylglutathione lyase family enzyme